MDEVIKHWTDIVVAVAAVAALIISFFSLRLSWRALRLSEQQEQRKRPKLIPELLDSHFYRNGPDRVYSFRLSVRNPTDSDNAIARIDMYLRYLVDGSTTMTVKLPSRTGADSRNDSGPRLAAPSRIAAHDTASGWCDFVVTSKLLGGHHIDGYQIVLTDSHQTEIVVDPIIVSEKRRDV